MLNDRTQNTFLVFPTTPSVLLRPLPHWTATPPQLGQDKQKGSYLLTRCHLETQLSSGLIIAIILGKKNKQSAQALPTMDKTTKGTALFTIFI